MKGLMQVRPILNTSCTLLQKEIATRDSRPMSACTTISEQLHGCLIARAFESVNYTYFGLQEHPLLLSGVLDYAARWHPEQVDSCLPLHASPMWLLFC